MKYLLQNGKAYLGKELTATGILIDGDRIVSISPEIPLSEDIKIIDCDGYVILPGLLDVHVHLREPGFSYKETIGSGTLAGAHGGYTDICPMPNLSPVPDSLPHLEEELSIIRKDAVINVHPYGAITVNEDGKELSDMEAMADQVIAFSDDGHGVQSDELMKQAMRKAASLGKMIVAHCEVNELSKDGYIHDGEYARLHGHRGISSRSEWAEIERDVELAHETGVSYHICHVSTKESVEIIRRAKEKGYNVTAETAPHYLLLSEKDLKEEGRFKMNPPLRGEDDKEALIGAIKDGTIDMIATDHAPHSEEEKSRGLEKSAFGITGLETAFPVLYTGLVRKGIISFTRLMELMHDVPMERFCIGNELKEGSVASLTVFDLENRYTIDPSTFLSKGRSTPFGGEEVYGKCVLTMVKGRIVWSQDMTER